MAALLDANRVNLATYSNAGLLSWYDRQSGLLAPERVILGRLRTELANKRLLDIGVGGGRTTRHLLAISGDYTGIDYAPQFVSLVRRKFSLDTIFHCDARDMARFRDAAFDLVFFSFNGLDYVDHEGRQQALREVHRVLAPRGAFVFSTHNRSWTHIGKLPWQQLPMWRPGFVRDCLTALVHTGRRRRMRRLEQRTTEYAILNDLAHAYSLLHYHITIPDQIRQLAAHGFGDTVAFDMSGTSVEDDVRHGSTYFLTRKASGG
jgi:SAM-dependent methyltransferase